MTSLEVAAQLPRLRRHARFLGLDAVGADDLVQETLIEAIARADRLRAGGDLRGRLLAVLHGILDAGDRARWERATDGPGQPGAARLGPLRETRVEPRQTRAALDRLADEQRRVVLLVSVDGMTTGQAAAILAVPAGTARARLARGRDALRRMTRGAMPAGGFLSVVGGTTPDPIANWELSAFIDGDLPPARMAEIDATLECLPEHRQALLEMLADHWSLAAIGQAELQALAAPPPRLAALAAALADEIEDPQACGEAELRRLPARA